MKIGELAAATGLAPSAIRFYEQGGVLPPPQRTANGYRSYSAEAVARLRYIQLARALGFTLETLRAGLVTHDMQTRADRHHEMLQRLDVRLVEIDRMLATLRARRKDLLAARECLLAAGTADARLDPASVQLPQAEHPAPAHASRVTHASAPRAGARPRARGAAPVE